MIYTILVWAFWIAVALFMALAIVYMFIELKISLDTYFRLKSQKK